MANREGRRKRKQKAAITPAILQEVETLKSHPAVVENSVQIGALYKERLLPVRFSLRVLEKQGDDDANPEGVRGVEPVTIYFPLSYPVKPPRPYLRPDFRDDLPHVNPFRGPQNEVSPCVFYGKVEDLIAQPQGFELLINRMVDWLRDAAFGELTNPRQGWEPQRRDDLDGYLIIDRAQISAKAKSKKANALFRTKILFDLEKIQNEDITGLVGNVFTDEEVKPEDIDPRRLNLDGVHYIRDGKVGFYETFCVAAQSPKVVDVYKPNAVQTYEQLLELADEYGCKKVISDVVGKIAQPYFETYRENDFFIFTVLLIVQRPLEIIGSNSVYEILPYCIKAYRQKLKVGTAFVINPSSPVEAWAHRDKLSQSVLRRLSGLPEDLSSKTVHFLGCGSVGSKIAIHLARSGLGPFKLYDREAFDPHNAARHGLYDVGFQPGLKKATALAYALIELKADAEPFTIDIAEFLSESGVAHRANPKEHILIDATGSLPVADQITGNNKLSVPVVQVGLYRQGRAGFLACESSMRGVRLGDLRALFWRQVLLDSALERALSENSGPERVPVGQGCNSTTMIMGDHVVSEYAAGMSGLIRDFITEAQPEKAHLWIGTRNENPGVSWKRVEFSDMVCPDKADTCGWEIRIAAQADEEMKALATKFAPREYGGTVFGTISLLHRRITVTHVVEPPPDTVFDETRFILGTQGLKELAVGTAQKSQGNIIYLGTWHSHPKGGGPSEVDRTSAKEILKKRLGTPVVLLIWTPSGYYAAVEPKSE